MAALLDATMYAGPPRAAQYAVPLNQPPKLIVLHCTANTASKEAEAKYAATRTDDRAHWTSCHLYVDETGILGSLPLDKQAWAAYNWANARAWQVEMCGRENAVPEATQRRAAALVRQLCQLGGIPTVHLDGPAVRALHDGTRSSGGVAGHHDITLAGFDGNTHTDPGDQFDWARFMTWVNDGGDEMSQHAEDVLAALADGLASLDGKPFAPHQWQTQIHDHFDQVMARLAALEKPQFTDAQVADMADRLRANLRAAIEDALRDVLGSLDVPPPPA